MHNDDNKQKRIIRNPDRQQFVSRKFLKRWAKIYKAIRDKYSVGEAQRWARGFLNVDDVEGITRELMALDGRGGGGKGPPDNRSA